MLSCSLMTCTTSPPAAAKRDIVPAISSNIKFRDIGSISQILPFSAAKLPAVYALIIPRRFASRTSKSSDLRFSASFFAILASCITCIGVIYNQHFHPFTRSFHSSAFAPISYCTRKCLPGKHFFNNYQKTAINSHLCTIPKISFDFSCGPNENDGNCFGLDYATRKYAVK